MERKSQLPPGPSGSWRPTLELIRNPRAAMEKRVGRYGDPFLLHCYEMTMVLGTLLRRYLFELVDSAPVVPKRKNVTIGPSTKVPVRVLGVR